MIVKNIDDLDLDLYKCNRIVGEYIQQKGVCPINFSAKEYSFVRTENLNAILRHLPLWIKLIGGRL